MVAGPNGTLFIGLAKDDKRSLHVYSIEKEELEEMESDINTFVISDNREHLLLSSGDSWYITSTNGKLDKKEDYPL